MDAAHVLIVGADQRQSRRLYSSLGSTSRDIRIAESAASALSATDESSFDLILICIHGEAGHDINAGLVETLKAKLGLLVPVILVSNEIDETARLAGLEAGADDAVSESIHGVELILRIRRLLRIKKMQDSLARANAELGKLSITDSLTGLFNRRHIMDRLYFEVERCKRYGSPLSCVMLDIDHFKDVNDTYGHQCGDKVLQRMASIFLTCTRRVDIVGRFGGEEFLMLLPETPTAVPSSDRIRSLVESENFDIGGGITIKVTISAGIASWKPEYEHAERFLQLADQALYLAKQSGRNRVCTIP